MPVELDRLRVLVVCCLALAGCESAPIVADAGRGDAGPRDSGPPDAGDPPLVPDQVCPGSEGCMDGTPGTLRVGAARQEITPDPSAAEQLTVDVDGNGEWNPEDGDVFDDRDGDGVFDAVWMAGFGTGRAATGVSDPQYATAVVLENGETSIAFVSIDCVGYFVTEMDRVRALVSGLAIDYVVVSATHVHEARDTVGIWGATLADSGYDEAYMTLVAERAAAAVREAHAALTAAHVEYSSFFLRDVDDPLRWVGDNRDPFVMDDELRMMRFVRADGDATLATMINYAAHPEYGGSRNTLLSSDYVHWLRDGIERGADGPTPADRREGVGGITLFVNGALGVQIGPNRVHIERWDGTPVSDDSLAASQVVGEQLAWHALGALTGGGVISEETAALAFRRARFLVKIENTRYHIAFQQGLFRREVVNYDPTRPIRAGMNIPDTETEIALIDVGLATMLSIPGELDPVLFVGGYDGAFTPEGTAVVDTTRENPPDLAMAPEGPYLRDLLAARRGFTVAEDGVRVEGGQVWLLGLTNDFLGYFLPSFDYELDRGLPYIGEAPGAHYEETNSIGPLGWPRVEGKIHELISWTP